MKKLFYTISILLLLFSCQEEIEQPPTEQVDYSILKTRLTNARSGMVEKYNQIHSTDNNNQVYRTNIENEISPPFEETWGIVPDSLGVIVPNETNPNLSVLVEPLISQDGIFNRIIVSWEEFSNTHYRIFTIDDGVSERSIDSTPIPNALRTILISGDVTSYTVRNCSYFLTTTYNNETCTYTNTWRSYCSPVKISFQVSGAGCQSGDSPPSSGGGSGGGGGSGVPPADPECIEDMTDFGDTEQPYDDEPECVDANTLYSNCLVNGSNWSCCNFNNSCTSREEALQELNSFYLQLSLTDEQWLWLEDEASTEDLEIIDEFLGNGVTLPSEAHFGAIELYVREKLEPGGLTVDDLEEFLDTVRLNIQTTLQYLTTTGDNYEDEPCNDYPEFIEGKYYYGNWGTEYQPVFGTMGKLYGTLYFWREEYFCPDPCFNASIEKQGIVYYELVEVAGECVWKRAAQTPEFINLVQEEDLAIVALETVKFLAKYNPILDMEAVWIVIDGNDFNGNPGNEIVSGTFILLDVTPLGKVGKGLRFIKNVLPPGIFRVASEAGETLIRITDEGIYLVKKKGLDLIQQAVRHLDEVIPSGSNFTSIGKQTIRLNGRRIVIEQPDLKAIADDIIVNGDALGLKTEHLADEFLTRNGFVKKLTQMDVPPGSGFDGVYIKYADDGQTPLEIIINESKYKDSFSTAVGSNLTGLTLNPPGTGTSTLKSQMSDGWIEQVIQRMQNDANDDVRDLGLLLFNQWEQDKSKFTKLLTAFDTHLHEFNIIKLGNYYTQ